MPTATTTRLRVWDWPTRIFHWTLAASTAAMVITAQIGGNAMEWHLRLGHLVLALLLFRVLWGLAGGHWSRFATFIPAPARLWRYLQDKGVASDRVGHSPLGAVSVLSMLLILGTQVGTGLVSDDEIAFAGSLVRHVSADTVNWATNWHKHWGQWLVYAMVALHIGAIVYYRVWQRQHLVPAMLHGDKQLPEALADLPPSRDDLASWVSALFFAAACAVMAYWVWTRATAF